MPSKREGCGPVQMAHEEGEGQLHRDQGTWKRKRGNAQVARPVVEMASLVPGTSGVQAWGPPAGWLARSRYGYQQELPSKARQCWCGPEAGWQSYPRAACHSLGDATARPPHGQAAPPPVASRETSKAPPNAQRA